MSETLDLESVRRVLTQKMDCPIDRGMMVFRGKLMPVTEAEQIFNRELAEARSKPLQAKPVRAIALPTTTQPTKRQSRRSRHR